MTEVQSTPRIISTTSRNLTQDELDGYHRYKFIQTVLNHVLSVTTDEGIVDGTHRSTTVGGRPARFLAQKNGKFNLVEISERTPGEWEFSIADKHFYTYRFGDLVNFIEQLYDEFKITPLNKEIVIQATHVTANE